MSKIFRKLTGSKNVRLSVCVEEIVVTGKDVVDKEVYGVRWYVKGARGKDSGDSPNVYATTDEEHDTPVVRFVDVLSCEVSATPHKNSRGYNEVPLELKVVSPALSKKDDKPLGKVTIDALLDVGTLTPPATVRTEQDVVLNKEGGANAHILLRIELKSSSGSEEDAAAATTAAATTTAEPMSPTGSDSAQIVSTNEAQTLETTQNAQGLLSGIAGMSSSSRLKVREPKTPPSSPGKAYESLGATDAAASERGETDSRRSHRSRHHKHRSSISAATLLQKEEEYAKAKKDLEEKLAAKTAEAEQLQERVAELEQTAKDAHEQSELKDALAKAESDAADAKADAQKTRDELAKVQEQLGAAQDEARKAQQDAKTAQDEAAAAANAMKAATAAAALNAESDEERERRNRELEALKKQLAALQDECVKLRGAPKADAAAAAKPNVLMLAIAAVVGAILAIILRAIF